MVVGKIMRTQGVVVGVGLLLATLVYFVGVNAWGALMQKASAQVLGAQTAQGSYSRRPLAYAPDIPPPTIVDGMAPVLYRVPTDLPVAFLTIDDGFYRDPAAARAMQDAHIPATLFLVNQYVSAAPQYFDDLAKKTGSSIENHTLVHKELTTLVYADQKTEICGAADAFAKVYGHRPQLLRPPYGSYNDDTRRASAACGMRAVVHWRALVSDGVMQYQVGDKLRPGDIVLMHFTPNFEKDLQAFNRASQEAGLTPQPLNAWLAD